MTSPGQALRDDNYAAALWLLDADPSAALAVLRLSHAPPGWHFEAPAREVKDVIDLGGGTES